MTCHGCDAELPPNLAPGRQRKWCSGRCRKKTLYSGTCVDCGALTNGYAGPGRASERCIPCHLTFLHETRHWTPERVIASISEFVAENGRVPRAADFHPALALQKGHVGRTERDRWPHPTGIVAREFGSWNEGIRAAGFEPFDHTVDHTWGPNRPLYDKAWRLAERKAT